MKSARRHLIAAVHGTSAGITLLAAVAVALIPSDDAAQAQSAVPAAPRGLAYSSVAHDSVTLTCGTTLGTAR